MTIALFRRLPFRISVSLAQYHSHPLTHGCLSGDKSFEKLLSIISSAATWYFGSNAGI
jgi:hypothetical protein